MRISLEWLSQYVDIAGLTPEEIASALTNSGLEVEAIERIGGQFTNVVVGKVRQIEPHPNADRLRLATVDLGGTQNKVVCGAPNLKEGMLIAYAQEGAQVVNRKEGGLFTLTKAKIRGVESTGMICSLEELGLEDWYPKQEDGIWPLNEHVTEAQLGQDLKMALGLEADTILEVAPTANRGDLMSMVGVAREVAALFNRDLNLPELATFEPTATPVEMKVVLSDLEVCRYYGGLMMRNLQVGPSPDWLVRRLQAAGVRSISNVVDVTNYVMLEMGQPLHAFDQDKLGHAGTVSVRRAQNGEEFTTLDGETHTLTPESIVVTMNDQPVALGGVMGGLNTEIDESSKILFLEAAYFPPASNRKSAKSVGIRTDSSARFERGVDPEGCRKALFRAAQLIQELAGADYVQLVETPPLEIEKSQVQLRLARLKKVLGLSLEPGKVQAALNKLGFTVQANAEGFLVTVPSFRAEDVTREIDVIEEVIRIHGYDHVPYTLPRKTASAVISLRDRLLRQLHQSMRSLGLQEVVTTSLIGPALLEKTGFPLREDQMLRVTNSHSSEHTVMRQSLLPNLLEVAKFNEAQGSEAFWLYELGRTYFKVGKPNLKNAGVAEKLSLSGLLHGSVREGIWHQQALVNFYCLKGVVENLLAALNLMDEAEFQRDESQPYLHPGKSARLLVSGKDVGTLGELHPLTQERLKFRQPVYVFELNIEALYKIWRQRQKQPSTLKVSSYPAVKRDMAFAAPDTLSHQEIMATLRHVQEPLLKAVELFDEYRGEKLGAGMRSLAYRLTFQSSEATLTDAQVDQALTRLKDTLLQKLQVQFR